MQPVSPREPDIPIETDLPEHDRSHCDRCDPHDDAKTYANQACMPIDGKVQCIDWCIHHIIAALNAGGVRTFASCCGHGKIPGRIDLEDGRLLLVLPDGSAAGKEPYHVPSVNKAPICTS